MILADSSIWIGHLRKSDAVLTELVTTERLLGHPYALTEILLGNIKNREAFKADSSDLPQAIVAFPDEGLGFIERQKLSGVDIGFVVTHLLLWSRLSNALLWTGDRRLAAIAERLGVAFQPS